MSDNMGIRTEVRCDGKYCMLCYFANDKVESFGKVLGVRCDAHNDAYRDECKYGEVGYFDLPPQEIEFVKGR